jgi:flavin reductase (DIM6/NTAB) family NADH-FMN oxidoreductase RutF
MKQVSFSEAMKKKYPEWVVLIGSIDDRGQANVMPAGWAMIVSSDPPMFAVAVNHKAYTHSNIQSQREFVIGFPGPGMEEVIKYCGSRSGRDVDKFKGIGLKALPAARIKTPLIGGCIVNLECALDGELETGDHTVFAGRVVAAYVDDSLPGRLMNFNGEFALARMMD